MRIKEKLENVGERDRIGDNVGERGKVIFNDYAASNLPLPTTSSSQFSISS